MVTLKDVALASGVSTATASYVVNNGPRPVLPKTRDRVLRAITELGYQPNAAARSLMGKRTHTFGIVFPHVIAHPFDNQYFSAVLSGIIDEATERKQFAMLFTGLDWEEAERSVPLFCDGRCDGFLFVAPPAHSRLVDTLLERNKHVVLLGTRALGVNVGTVDAKIIEGSRMATRHLLELGHRRIGMLKACEANTSTVERLDGFRLALTEYGLSLDDAVIVPDRQGEETSVDVARRLLLSEEGRSLTGLVCAHDSTAACAIEAAMSIGKRVPEDLSVVGFDDVPLAKECTPQITTVRQPLREIGVAAAVMLFELIDDPKSQPQERLFDVELIKRASTAPPSFRNS